MLDGWTWVWIVGGAAALFVIAVFAFRSPYSKVLADAHLDEVCATLDRIRLAACERVGASLPASPAAAATDPRYAETTAGLRLAYTVGPSERDATRFRHYVSMSHARRLPAESFTRFVLGLVVVRCGRSAGEVAAARSANLVTHLAFELEPDEHEEFVAAARDAEPPGVAAIHALRRRWADAGAAVRLDVAR